MKRIVLALVALASGLYGCRHDGGQVDLKTKLDLDTLSYHKLFTIGDGIPEQSLDIEITYIYPKNDSLVAHTLSRQFFPDSLMLKTTAPDSLIKLYSEIIYENLAPPKLEKDEIEDSFGVSWNWSFSEDNDLIYHDRHIVSCLVNSYQYEGGAHGLYGTDALCIDRATGRVLQEKDLFSEGYEGELAKIIVDRLMAMHSVSSPKELREYGYFAPEEIAPNNNFYLTDTDMIYIFNIYEIAPYAFGRIEVKIPFDLLGRLIRTGSILEHYV